MDSGKSSPTKYGESAPREPGKSGSSYTAMAISDKQKQKQSQKTANLKYRTNSKVPWKCLESEFFFEGVEDTDPEPPNVQEVVFTNEGIALRQCSVLFNRKVNVGEITDEVHCWEAVFSISKMRDIVCQQYEVASWLFNAPPGSKKVLNVLRFKYTGEPHNEDKSQNRESTAAEDNTQALESADTMDADKEPNAAEFKLKLLCQEMAKVPSMEIGLAFKASTARFDKGAYFWMWPLVINLLVGRVYRTKDRDENKAGLNEWAEANKDRHERALLKKVTVDGEVGWSVKIKLPTKSSGPTKSLGPAPSLGAAPSSGPAPSLGPTDLDPEVYGLPKRRACDSVQEMEEELARTRAAHLKASRLEQAAEEQVREATRALTEAQRRYTQASNVRKQWQNTLLVAEDALAVAKGGSGPR